VIDYRYLVSFLNGLNSENINFEIPLEKQRKLKALAECTFYNRESILQKFQLGKNQKTLNEFN